MKDLNEAILYYNIGDRIEYQRYADFLRFAGIFVCEKCNIFEGEGQKAEADAEAGTLVFSVPSEKPWKEEDVLSDEEKQRASLNRLLDTWGDLLEGTEYKQAFQQLLDVFVKEDLFRAGATLQFFRKKDELVEKAGNSFESAWLSLQELMRNDKSAANNKHIWYACIYCGQKANLARNVCNMPGYVSAVELAGQCLDLIGKKPEFSNVWALLGLVYEFAGEKIADAVDAFARAGKAIGNRPYASSIYYWMGKRCEGDSKDADRSKRAYRRAYKLDQKYRVIYKVAWGYEMEHKYANAAEYYKKCLDRIRKKETFMDPLEQEYQYKVLVKIGYIYLKELNSPECISLFRQALKLRENIQQGCKTVNEYTKYYFELYGNEAAPQYVELELSRMQTSKIDQYIVYANKKWNFEDR